MKSLRLEEHIDTLKATHEETIRVGKKQADSLRKSLDEEQLKSQHLENYIITLKANQDKYTINMCISIGILMTIEFYLHK